MFKRKSVDKSTVVLLTTLGIVIVGVFCFLQILDYSMVHKVTMNNMVNNEDFEWKIDSINIDNNYIAVSGWAYLLSEGSKSFDVTVILENIETKEAIAIPTTLLKNEKLIDVDGQNYAESGFVARVHKSLIDFPSNEYEIYLEYQDPDHQVFIKTYQPLEIKIGD